MSRPKNHDVTRLKMILEMHIKDKYPHHLTISDEELTRRATMALEELNNVDLTSKEVVERATEILLQNFK